ncbi:NADPH:quinone reductase [Arthrobacter sedimenti]|uniref:NADPH:quinone reductase n=1 Tax=Arthrobacter sedimenti TaxID=2694931 RepID=UPI0014202974|nr:NADPH:quinone reductase [Arthrobacter sedimenti]
MKRIEISRYGPEEVLAYVSGDAPVHIPASPGHTLDADDAVTIDVRAIGVNPADTYLRAGNYEFLTPSIPFTPGYDAAGIISAVGASVTSFAVGDRVWVSTIPARAAGTYAQQIMCTPSIVHALPEHLSFDEGAAVGLSYTTAYRALVQRGQAVAGETVLIHGASGGVGTAAVQLAYALGLTVIGTASTPEGRKLVLKLGARHALDHSGQDYLAEAQGLTGGLGFHLIIEMAAHKNLSQDTGTLSRNGRIVVVGSRGPVEMNPRALMVNETDVRGTAVWNMTPVDLHDAYIAIDAFLQERVIRPVVGEHFALEDAIAAHQAIAGAHSPGRIILHP